jgi:glycerophosphoryl diester phosphodiesterase
MAVPEAGYAGDGATAPKVVFGHMLNTRQAVDWAMAQGVNGAEMDLRFDAKGRPSVFRHSQTLTEPCDCALPSNLADPHAVCNHMGKLAACLAETPAGEMLSHLARTYAGQLAVLYVDSKVDDSDPPDLAKAGKNVIKFLDAHLFAKGYAGDVIISAEKTAYSAYTKAAVAAAGVSPNKAKYFFTFDGQSSRPNLLPNPDVAESEFLAATQALLDLGTPNRVYSVGIAAFAPGKFYDQVVLSAYNRKIGVLAATGIWTLDDKDAMDYYLGLGVDSIVTNRPTYALNLLAEQGIPLAKPGQALRPATSTRLATGLPAGERCESNSNCAEDACGRATAAPGAAKLCCPSGQYVHRLGFDYCAGMPATSICWTDSMCASGTCSGNLFGTQKGRCE